jgi:arginase
VAARVAGRVAQTVAAGRGPLLLGGDCTITLGVVAGLLRHHPDVGLLYFDGDVDLSTPAATQSGILDAMGVAHLLGDGAPALARVGPRHPMLPAERLLLFGFDPVGVGPRHAGGGEPAWPARVAGDLDHRPLGGAPGWHRARRSGPGWESAGR